MLECEQNTYVNITFDLRVSDDDDDDDQLEIKVN